MATVGTVILVIATVSSKESEMYDMATADIVCEACSHSRQ